LICHIFSATAGSTVVLFCSHWGSGRSQLAIRGADDVYFDSPPDDMGCLVFPTAYPVDEKLSNTNLPILTIYTARDLEKFHPRFPQSTEWVVINGGNHAGFGWYGKQVGDNPASISLQVQGSQVLQSIDQFMKKMENIK
jgi:hypothetical protein